MDNHYSGLFASYSVVAALIWLLTLSLKPQALENPRAHYQQPWRDLGIYLIAVIAILAIGQLYAAGMLLSEEHVAARILNQVSIFSPALAFLAWKRSPSVAFLPPRTAPVGFALGLMLALIAVSIYFVVRGRADEIGSGLLFLLSPQHIPLIVQILLEDIAIAILLGLAVAVLGARGAVIATALLFAAAHVPAILANGSTVASSTSVLLDTLLGVVVLGALLRTRSIWWFWPVHSVLDLLQFYKPH